MLEVDGSPNGSIAYTATRWHLVPQCHPWTRKRPKCYDYCLSSAWFSTCGLPVPRADSVSLVKESSQGGRVGSSTSKESSCRTIRRPFPGRSPGPKSPALSAACDLSGALRQLHRGPPQGAAQPADSFDLEPAPSPPLSINATTHQGERDSQRIALRVCLVGLPSLAATAVLPRRSRMYARCLSEGPWPW